MPEFSKQLQDSAHQIERYLQDLLRDEPTKGEIMRAPRLMGAMRHSVLGGGKRLRPFLVMESAALGGVSSEHAMAAAAALELIHCYSLVHDDLPAMDDDDLRRGKPTTHIAFDEATAILSGDGLLTLAFQILSDPETHMDPAIRLELVSLYASAAGIGGMVGGQMLDLQAETQPPDEEGIQILQAMKTGALIRVACEAGTVLSMMDTKHREALVAYGIAIGQAFQLADDILDVTANAQDMGKATAKDAERGKGTLVSIYGLDKARTMADSFIEKALNALQCFGPQADTLRDAARFIVRRNN